MIRQIRGHVLSVDLAGAVVEVAGFGILVRLVAPETLIIGKEFVLHTHLAIRQDGADFYGFTSPEDLAFFELLLKVPGVGPKTVLSILRRAPQETLSNAIAARDISYLTRVVGLGKKTAEKMVVELSEKMVASGANEGDDGEILDTLIALGYTEREARKALTSLPKSITGKDARLKAALSKG